MLTLPIKKKWFDMIHRKTVASSTMRLSWKITGGDAVRRKCHACLCRTCLKTCKCENCKGKIESCENYSGFRQLSIFEPPPQQKYKSAPRHSWEYYGISKERYRQLTEYIQSGRYATVARQAAHTANKDIAEYILLSATKNLSYDELQKMWELKKIERMACCRTDFYGYRRLFYSIMDRELRRIGK